VLLGHGKAGALRIYEAFCEETARTADEAKAALSAVATIAGCAHSTGLTAWDLTGVTVEAARGNQKPKLLVELEPGLDERLRAACALRNESLRQFTEEAIRDRLARIERRPRSTRAARAAAAQ
jgi:hypothetical protein